MYPMTVEFSRSGYTTRDGNHVRTLICPKHRLKQWNQQYYNFSKELAPKHLMGYFKETKESKTHSALAKRVWDAFWEEGWREKL